MENGLGQDPQQNGLAPIANEDIPLSQALQALEVIYSPNSSNDSRRDATIYLEQAKTHPQAPAAGFQLALSSDHVPHVRLYGLTILDHAVKYKWQDYDSQQRQTIRDWIIQLARNVDTRQPVFLGNKIAQLWVEAAKKCWLSEWDDFDERLQELWTMSGVHQEVVLHVLETLSEDVFSTKDPSGAGRDTDLGAACVAIFTEEKVLDKAPSSRANTFSVRHGPDGWLKRVMQQLPLWLNDASQNTGSTFSCFIRAFALLRSAMTWVMLRSVSNLQCVLAFCSYLSAASNVEIRLGAIECLHALYHRPNYGDGGVIELVVPVISTDGVILLKTAYESLTSDDDDENYLALKKFTEVMCALAMFVEQRPHLFETGCDLHAILALFLSIMEHPSLVVSLPVIYAWTKLLASSTMDSSKIIPSFGLPLLTICTKHLLRYEAFPNDSTDPTCLFLKEDFDTIPERHAFLGNYRRFCMAIIENIVRRNPQEGVGHLFTNAKSVIDRAIAQDDPLNAQNFSNDSPAILQVDAQCTVISASMKGYVMGKTTFADESFVTALEEFCSSLLSLNTKNPVIRRRLLQQVVTLTLLGLPVTSRIPITLCESMLSWTPSVPDEQRGPAYSDALLDLQAAQARDLKVLALKFSDVLFSVYQDLESALDSLHKSGALTRRMKTEYQALLISVIVHASTVDQDTRESRLRVEIKRLVHAWSDPALAQALSSFGAFCGRLGLSELPDIFLSSKAEQVEDWSQLLLSEDGQTLRDRISAVSEQLPLEATRALLSSFVDVSSSHPTFTPLASVLWSEAISPITSSLLSLIRHAHAFGNPTSWSAQPVAMQSIIPRIMKDRVWQAGISAEGRDDFYARVRDSRATLEGLASSVRGAVRTVRETSYWILQAFTYHKHGLYDTPHLASALASALYADSHALTAHLLASLLRTSTALVFNCPPHRRVEFLPEIVGGLFKQLDVKTCADWSAYAARTQNGSGDHGNGGDEGEMQLDEEMKTESYLRQLTFSAVTLAASVLTSVQVSSSQRAEANYPPMRDVLLTHPAVLEILVLFLTHALRMQDSRSCTSVTRTLRSIVPAFTADAPPPLQPHNREDHDGRSQTAPPPARNVLVVDPAAAAGVRGFFTTEVLMACLGSLHDAYFADVHKDIAALIVAILVHFAPASRSATAAVAPSAPELEDPARAVLLSLPGMTPAVVDGHLASIRVTSVGPKATLPLERARRAEVLALLEGVRGVSMYELGKVVTGARAARVGRRGGGGLRGGERTAMQEQFMAVDEAVAVVRGGSPEAGSLADLFG